MRRHIAAILTVAMALLAACGSGDEPGKSAGAIAPEAAAVQLGEAVRLRPGQYDTEMEMLDFSIAGLPKAQADAIAPMMRGNMATHSSFCLTPQDAAKGPEQMAQEMADAKCSYDRFDFSGGRLSAEMRCKGEGRAEGHYVLDGQMGPESSTITMTIDQPMPQMPGAGTDGRMNMKMRVSSHRTGDCA